MPASRISRPYVILNAAMSLDGKIATYTGDSRMSSPADLRRVHRLRASVDGIMVGMRTLLRDNPKLTGKLAKDRKPYRIVVDSNARTPLTSYVVRTAKEIPTIVAVTSGAPKNRVEILEQRGVKGFLCGKGRLVSVKILLQNLRKLGIPKILLETSGRIQALPAPSFQAQALSLHGFGSRRHSRCTITGIVRCSDVDLGTSQRNKHPASEFSDME